MLITNFKNIVIGRKIIDIHVYISKKKCYFKFKFTNMVEKNYCKLRIRMKKTPQSY